MRATRILKFAALAVGLALPLSATGCGGNKKDAVVTSKVKPGDMPEGADWSGVYYSSLYGHLHLVKEGKNANGAWRTTGGDKWGELHGEVTGDLLRFEWVEHTIGMVGPSANRNGKGYFKYARPAGENVEDEIHGEWGLGASDAGNTWNAVKQRNQKPDLASVTPDEVEAPRTGGGWDDKKGGGDEGGGDEGGGDEGGGDEKPPEPL